ncbi:MAG: hypothetical protein ACLPWG_14970 [Steroidobacteraceae bacterium]
MNDLLIAIIIAGIGLSVAYLRAELLLHRRLTAVQRRREVLQRELHIKKVRSEQNDMPRRPASRRGRNIKERKKAIVQRELHTNRLRLEWKHAPVTALGIHQHFLCKESGNRPVSATAQLSA